MLAHRTRVWLTLFFAIERGQGHLSASSRLHVGHVTLQHDILAVFPSPFFLMEHQPFTDFTAEEWRTLDHTIIRVVLLGWKAW